MPAQPASLLATRRGKLLLLLLCAVQFLDVVDSSIMNAALPSIRRDLRATNSRGEPVIHPADGTPRRPRAGSRAGTGRLALVRGNPR